MAKACIAHGLFKQDSLEEVKTCLKHIEEANSNSNSNGNDNGNSNGNGDSDSDSKSSGIGSRSASKVEVSACTLASQLYQIMSAGDSDSNSKLHDRRERHVVVSLGEKGVIWCRRDSTANNPVQCTILPAIKAPKSVVVNVNGVGDNFCAGLLHSMVSRKSAVSGLQFDDLRAGLLAAHEKLCKAE